jgi:hypothetical protein
MRCSGTVLEYLQWTEGLMQDEEQIYPDVNVVVTESFLRLEADGLESSKIRAIAGLFLSGKSKVPGAEECRALAPLLMLRFGDKRSLPSLRRCFDNEKSIASAHLLRSTAMVYSSYGNTEFGVVRRSASRLLRNHLADVVRLVERIRKYPDVPIRYRARLLRLATAPGVGRWVADWKTEVLSQPISEYDRRIVMRLL